MGEEAEGSRGERGAGRGDIREGRRVQWPEGRWWAARLSAQHFDGSCVPSSLGIGTQWRNCPAAGGPLILSPLLDGRSGEVTCPPVSELCPVDGALWPELFSISPAGGSFRGGTLLSLSGARLSSLKSPVKVGTRVC